jgi:hypothetical protein
MTPPAVLEPLRTSPQQSLEIRKQNAELLATAGVLPWKNRRPARDLTVSDKVTSAGLLLISSTFRRPGWVTSPSALGTFPSSVGCPCQLNASRHDTARKAAVGHREAPLWCRRALRRRRTCPWRKGRWDRGGPSAGRPDWRPPRNLLEVSGENWWRRGARYQCSCV